MTPDYSRDFVKVPQEVLLALIAVPNALRVYLLCLTRVRYTPSESVRGGYQWLDIGQLIAGEDKLALQTGLTRAKVRVALTQLERLGVLARQTTRRGSVVTLCGYKEGFPFTPRRSPTEKPSNSQDVDLTSPNQHRGSATNKIRDPEIEIQMDQSEGGTTPSLPRRRPAPKVNVERRVRRVKETFDAAYAQRYEDAHVWDDADRENLEHLVRTIGSEPILRRIEIMFNDPPDYLTGVFTWKTLLRNFNPLTLAATEANAQRRAQREERERLSWEREAHDPPRY